VTQHHHSTYRQARKDPPLPILPLSCIYMLQVETYLNLRTIFPRPRKPPHRPMLIRRSLASPKCHQNHHPQKRGPSRHIPMWQELRERTCSVVVLTPIASGSKQWCGETTMHSSQCHQLKPPFLDLTFTYHQACEQRPIRPIF